MTKRPQTQRDIARRFGVSQAAVSMALRGKGRIGQKLSEAVVKEARKSGYSSESHFHARTLANSRYGSKSLTNVVCAALYDPGLGENNRFHSRLLRGIWSGAEETGNELVIAPRSSSRKLPRVVARRQVDGLIWLLTDSDFLNNEPACPVPVVSLFFSIPGADCVAVNDQAAMFALGSRLAASGHTRVAFVGPVGILARQRLAGLRDGLAATGAQLSNEDVQTAVGAMKPETSLPLVRSVMNRRMTLPPEKQFTALAVYNDFMAATAIRCIREEYGLRVPGDISVTGFDGANAPGAPAGELTTMAVPLEQMGAEAARLIAWRLVNPEADFRKVVFEAAPVEGETVCPPPGC